MKEFLFYFNHATWWGGGELPVPRLRAYTTSEKAEVGGGGWSEQKIGDQRIIEARGGGSAWGGADGNSWEEGAASGHQSLLKGEELKKEDKKPEGDELHHEC